MGKDKRFVQTYKESGVRVLVDKTTGVNYLYMSSGYGGGVTPLLNADGTPIITHVSSLGSDPFTEDL